MPSQKFYSRIKEELERIDAIGITKRNEKVIEGFSSDEVPLAIINDKS